MKATEELAPAPALREVVVSDEWGTPDSVLEAAEFRLDGPVFLDVCPSPRRDLSAHRIRPAWSPDTDALEVPNELWPEYVFCNPPFSRLADFLSKITSCYAYGRIKQALVVVPAYTDRPWWRRFVEPHRDGPGRAWRTHHIGRHKFIPLLGQKTSSPRFGTCLLRMPHD